MITYAMQFGEKKTRLWLRLRVRVRVRVRIRVRWSSTPCNPGPNPNPNPNPNPKPQPNQVVAALVGGRLGPRVARHRTQRGARG